MRGYAGLFCVGMFALTACAEASEDADAGPPADAQIADPDGPVVDPPDAAPDPADAAVQPDAADPADGGVIAGACSPGVVTSVTNDTAVAIPDLTTTTSTVTVAGADPHVATVVLRTSITHTFNGDLDIVLESPRGTRVSITSDNAGTADDVFNGTAWTDRAADPVTDVAFTDGVAVVSVAPESALSAFFGEDPNGTWTLEVTDDAANDTGTLSSWTLELVGFQEPVTYAPASFASAGPVAIADATTTTDTIAVTGAPTAVCDLHVTTDISHTFAGDLDIALVSPTGTRAILTTDNGGSAVDVFAGTTWDDTANAPVSEHVFTSGVVAPSLTAEGALGAFFDEDPNGTWTLQITDDAASDTGTLNAWSIEVVGCSCP